MRIGAIIIISAVLIMVVILAVIGYTAMEVHQGNSYCENWFNNLEQRKAEMESSFWKELSFDYDQYNAEVAEYNRECAF
jgi:hypothetical protein